MKHLSKRIFALALVLAMVLSMVPAIPAAAADTQTAQLVSDVNDLKIGDRIIIVATDYTAALGTTQNSNNRSASTVSKSGSSVTFDESTQIITLGQGSKSGTYTLEVGEGQYLAATSSTSNSLRTVTTLQDSSSWSISIDTETAVAKIVSAGTTSRNEMRYNLSSKLFACYQSTSTQKTVQIYRLSQQPEYYLVGYINGANYGCEEDYQNLGQYKFVDGQLSVAFENDSYVFIKTGDNQNWFMTQAYSTDTTADFYSTATGAMEKMFIPGGVLVNFTLTVNADGSLTLRYTTGQTHTHSYEKAVTAPTCTEDGFTTYTCQCGDSYVADQVAALGHNYVDGLCSRCGAEDPDYVPPAYYLVGFINGANYGCEEDAQNPGQYEFVDGKLSATFDSDCYVFVKTGDNKHWFMAKTYVTDTTAVLYSTATGAMEKMFIPGGAKITFTLKVNADGSLTLSYEAEWPHQHSYEKTVTAPTCTEDGYTTYTCECGDSYVAGPVAALGHDYVDGLCSRCGAEDPDYIPPEAIIANLVTDHTTLTAGDTIIIVAADYEYALSTSQSTSSRGRAVVYKSKDGLTVGFGSDTQVLTLKNGTVEGTFGLLAGSKYLYAASSYSNYLKSATTLNANGSWRIVIDADGIASVTAAGSYSRNVLRYNASSDIFSCYAASNSMKDVRIYRIGDPHTHSYEKVVTAPTCTEDGFTTYTCECGDSYVADPVKALGHSYKSVTVDATCTKDGKITHTCTVCGNTFSETIPATGHSHTSKVTAPTCTEDGYTTYTCECGDTYVADYVDALGHDYADGICSRCGAEDPNYVPPAYYLVGFINGANYGCEEDAANPGQYKFVDGKLSAAFDSDCYVFVKTGDNKHWFMSKTYVTDTTAVLYSTATGAMEKMFIPGGAKITFTLKANADGSLTLSYEAEWPHQHSYEKTVTAPTCTEDGYTTYTCQCGDSYVADPVEALGHDYVDGLCSRCGAEDPDYIPPEAIIANLVTDHTTLTAGDTIIIVAADYEYALSTSQSTSSRGRAVVYKSKDGLTVGFGSDTQVLTLKNGTVDGTFGLLAGSKYLYAASSYSNYLKSATTLNANGSWRIVIDADGIASVTAAGSYSRNVLRYNASSGIFSCYAASNSMKDVRIYRIGDPHTHSYEKVVTAPTCTEDGYTTYTCECGDSYVADPVEALGHSYEKAVTAPTCTEKGYTTYTCQCGDSYVADPVAALGHDYVDGLCSRCGAEDPDYVPPAYYLVGFINGVNYGCEEDAANPGQYEFVDGKLSATFDSDCYVFVKTGDNKHWFMTKTYVTDTTAVLYSTATGAMEKMFIPGGAKITFTLTVNADGSLTLSYEAEWPHQHSYSAVVTAPTCTEDGYTTYTCQCGDSYVADPVEALGHSYNTVTVDATCTKNGKITHTCTLCGNTVSETIPATGHSYEKAITAPTCTEDGFTTYTCECGDTYVADYVDALGHDYVDGICSRCGAEDPDYVAPITLKIMYFSLSFEDEILINLYYNIPDITNVAEHGMLVFYQKPGTVSFGNADAVYRKSVYDSDKDCYMATTSGIAAKEMGDTRYYAVYARMADGTYVYTDAYDYSPRKYAVNMLGRDTTSLKQKALCVAMLNYGAAAQVYFGYRTDDLMNAGLTEAQQALVTAYDAALFKGAIAADASKTSAFAATAAGFSGKSASVSFEGAFAINYYLAPSAAVNGNMKLYIWTPEAYAAASRLTTSNASAVVSMEAQANGAYWGQVQGIAAKNLDETYYVAGVYTDKSGNTYCTGVMAYSLSKYCMNNAYGNMGQLAQATAMYGYYANEYFA